MNLLQKTQAYFQGKGKSLAIAVAPLAMVAATAIPAQAGIVAIFDIGGGSVAGLGSYDSASGALSSSNSPRINHVTGLSINGSGVVTASGGVAGLQFTFSGGGSGAFAMGWPLGIYYDFGVTPSNGGIVSWSLTMQAAADTTEQAAFSGSTASLAPGQQSEIAGLGSIDGLTGNFTGYFAELDVSWNGNSGDTLSVTIPAATSLDFNPFTIPTPEPSPFLSGLPGIAWLMRRALRKAA